MAEPTLREISGPPAASDTSDIEFLLSLRGLFSNGTSEHHEPVSLAVEDVHSTILDLFATDISHRIEQLSAQGRMHYDGWFDENGPCRPGLICEGAPDTHDASERNARLDDYTAGGVIIEWRWQPTGTTGSSIVKLDHVEPSEAMQLATDIAIQIE